VLLRRPDCVRGHSGPPGVGVCHPRIETPARPRKGQCLLRGRRVTLSRRVRRHSC
jgi:hypothetical protein